MSEIKTRRIFKTSNTNQTELKDLLQTIFIGEILSPSKCLWIISPWISNIEVINNESGSFNHLDPNWAKRQIRIIEVFIKILSMGSHLVIATRPVDHNQNFLNKLTDYTDEYGYNNNLTIYKNEILHNKGILGNNCYLNGSMNITYNGIEILDEQVTFNIGETDIAEAKLVFYNAYGGML